jgi:hypothetical protein
MTDRTQLIAMLEKRYPGLGAQWWTRCADWMLQETDPRLRETVREFAEGRPLSDIRFDGPDGKRYGVVQVMQERGNDDVVGALRLMERFFREPEIAIRAIRRPIR